MLENKDDFDEAGNMSLKLTTEYLDAVVYIQVNSWEGEKLQTPGSASGFLFSHGEISGLMTCHHAIPTKEDARVDRVFMGPDASFAVTKEPNELKQVVLDPEFLFITSKTLDYTIVGVKEDCSSPIKKFMPLWSSSLPTGAEICLLCHPDGGKRQHTFGNVTKFERNHVLYNVDTSTGSSGGPVVIWHNKTWWVVGLHNAAFNNYMNRGTYMGHIIENLQSTNDTPDCLGITPQWILDNWNKAYSWSDLAPAFSFIGGNLKCLDDVHKLTYEELNKANFLRLADGGYVDNTSVAYLIEHIQLNNWCSPKVVCLFMNSSSGIINFNDTRISSDVAKLFGHKKGVWSGYGLQLTSANAHVFKNQNQKWQSLWTYAGNNVTLNYYRLDAKTVFNKLFGIKEDEAYELHIFTSVHEGSGPVPMTERIMDTYDHVFRETRKGVNKGGWNHLEKVFSSRNVSLAFSGGGWHTHSALSGWIAGSLDMAYEKATVQKLFQNVECISANSGGTWFLSQLTYSEKFLGAIENDRDRWVETGFLGKTREMFKPFWCHENESTIDEDHCHWDAIVPQLMKKMIHSVGIGGLSDDISEMGGVWSFYKVLHKCGISWRRFVHHYAYGPWFMADEIGKLSLSDTTDRNPWGRNKELIIAASVLGGKDVLATKLPGIDYTAYKLLPHDAPVFFPLVFKNEEYHTYTHKTYAEYWKRKHTFFRHLFREKLERSIDTVGKGTCPIIDVCVAASSAMAVMASPDVITAMMEMEVLNASHEFVRDVEDSVRAVSKKSQKVGKEIVSGVWNVISKVPDVCTTNTEDRKDADVSRERDIEVLSEPGGGTLKPEGGISSSSSRAASQALRTVITVLIATCFAGLVYAWYTFGNEKK